MEGASEMKIQMGRRVSAIALAIASLGTAALSAAPAQASDLSGGQCTATNVSQPFTPWGDSNNYVLAPGGAFSGDTTDWSLLGGAKVQPGGEPYNVSDTDSASSVELPAGASVTSPYACVNLDYPTFRFFAKSQGLLGTVLVSIVWQEGRLGELSLPVGVVALSNTWKPSTVMLTGSGLGGALMATGGKVALRFTALTGSTRIDDVFIDPHMRT
jgi:hypothetical protein